MLNSCVYGEKKKKKKRSRIYRFPLAPQGDIFPDYLDKFNPSGFITGESIFLPALIST